MDYVLIPDGTVMEMVGHYNCEVEGCSNIAAMDNKSSRCSMGLETGLVIRDEGAWKHWCWDHIITSKYAAKTE